MRKIYALLPFVILWSFTASAQETASAPPPPLDPVRISAVMEKAVDDFIRPGYDRFRTDTQTLEKAMRALCASPSAGTLQAAQSGFVNALHAWSGIEIVRAGPVIQQNRFERVLYYPDKKGLGLKQVQRALSTQDETVTSVDGLKRKSVAAQGLGALEYVLYGAGSSDILSEKNSFRCRYGAAIAGNLASIGTELADEWNAPDGTAQHWKQPGADNPAYRDEREALVGLLGVLVHGAEAIRDQRIETFYKGPDNARFPRTAIYWRSGQTWASIGDNITALQSLLQKAGMVDLLPPDQRSIVSTIDFLATSMRRVTATIEPDIEKALADDSERGKIDYLLVNAKDVIYRLNDEYGGAIGLSSGFSFADGD